MLIIDNKKYRLPSGEYYHEAVKKTQIYLHHTVGGSIESTFKWWVQDPGKIGTAFLVARTGVVYEVFDASLWAHHLGLKIAQNTQCNKQSIGIEICSEGALRSGKELNQMQNTTKYDENFLYAFDGAKKLYHLTTQADMYVDLGEVWRGYRYFDAYDIPQLNAVMDLCVHLCDRFDIPKQLIPGDKNRFDISLATSFSGILTHANVREDKTDVHLKFPWSRLQEKLRSSFEVPITVA